MALSSEQLSTIIRNLVSLLKTSNNWIFKFLKIHFKKISIGIIFNIAFYACLKNIHIHKRQSPPPHNPPKKKLRNKKVQLDVSSKTVTIYEPAKESENETKIQNYKTKIDVLQTSIKTTNKRLNAKNVFLGSNLDQSFSTSDIPSIVNSMITNLELQIETKLFEEILNDRKTLLIKPPLKVSLTDDLSHNPYNNFVNYLKLHSEFFLDSEYIYEMEFPMLKPTEYDTELINLDFDAEDNTITSIQILSNFKNLTPEEFNTTSLDIISEKLIIDREDNINQRYLSTLIDIHFNQLFRFNKFNLCNNNHVQISYPLSSDCDYYKKIISPFPLYHSFNTFDLYNPSSSNMLSNNNILSLVSQIPEDYKNFPKWIDADEHFIVKVPIVYKLYKEPSNRCINKLSPIDDTFPILEFINYPQVWVVSTLWPTKHVELNETTIEWQSIKLYENVVLYELNLSIRDESFKYHSIDISKIHLYKRMYITNKPVYPHSNYYGGLLVCITINALKRAKLNGYPIHKEFKTRAKLNKDFNLPISNRYTILASS